MNLKETYNQTATTKSDINEHLPTLLRYGQECDTIIEMGVRFGRSTLAWLMAKPSKLVCYDLKVHKRLPLDIYKQWAKEQGINFVFIEGDTRKVKIEQADLLFIDTLHNYDQLKVELECHSDKANKYIILHDTETFGQKGETKGKGLQFAVDELLEKGIWKIKEVFKNNNGLTVLERV